MKKRIKLLLLFFSAAAFITAAATAFGQGAENKIETVFSSETLLIDVRTPIEFQYDHLEKAVNIPLNTIKEDIKYFAPDKEKAIALYCSSGKRSEFALKELKDLGYKNVVNAGKFMELKEIEKKRKSSNPDQ